MPDFRSPRLAVSAVFFLNGGLLGVWASRIPAFADRLALEPGTLGLVLLCLAGGAIIAFPLAGHMSDKHGASAVSRALAAIYAVTLCLLPLSANAWMLGLLLLFYGAALGALDVTMNAWAAEVEKRHGKPIMSAFHAIFSLGAGLGAGSGYLAIALGWSVAVHFLLMGIGLGIACSWLARVAWDSTRTAQNGKAPVFAIPRGALAIVGLVTFCSALGEGAVADWSGVYLDRVKGAGEAQAALGFAVFSAAMVAMRLIGDRVVDRLGPVPTARASGLVGLCGVLLAIFGGTGATLAGFALLGIGMAVIFPLAFSRAAADPEVSAGRAIASVATLGYGGGLVGPPAIGFVAEMTSLPFAFGLLAVAAAIIILLAGSLAR